MVQLTKHDLEFILKQIEIAEAHAAGGDLAALVAGYGGNDGLAQAHLLPYGLRTVDGSYNNLLPGREMWGAADQTFPGLFNQTYLNDADGDSLVFGPGMTYTNNDYGNAGPASGMSPGPGSGTVIDADPRIISNLIVDQSLGNPAAVMAGLQHAGVPAGQLMAALSAIVTPHKLITAAAKAQAAADAAPANATLAAAAVAAANAVAAYDSGNGAADALAEALETYGLEMDGQSVYLPNVSPDEGLSSPFNGWMTIFGQFFDHGLDLVAKGGNGTVYVPLMPDDPLYVPGSHTNFMPLTRVTVNAGPDGRLGTADDVAGAKNLTTPWVDQNQTYGSTASKQIFMREYTAGPDGKPIATGHLLEGSQGGPVVEGVQTRGGLATWADIKAQARDVLGINLTDADVGNIPLLASDEYGNFIRGANGYPKLVVGLGADGQLGTADDVTLEGNPAANGGMGVNIPATAIRTGHAFLDDIAHNAVPGSSFDHDNNPATPMIKISGDADNVAGNAIATDSRGNLVAYDDELLDAHYIAGDGRVNENIALTAVHHVFHSEHNRIVEQTKTLALAANDLAFLNEWLLVDVAATPTTPAAIAALVWDGERLFQAGRFTTEMEYQHLVFEEFGRMMQPDIDAFVFEPSADINPAIAAEFAHVVYRFGHSMLREDIARISYDENGNLVQDDIALFQGFLNPIEFASGGEADAAAGAIIRGMSRQTGSEIDEFVTGVLRNQLLGIPLDLATINLARGRDVGTPPLNEGRARFYAETGDTQLKPYESWADYAVNLKNPASVINFIAAYGTHATVTGATTAEAKRDAATLLVLGGTGAPTDRLDFLNATGAYAGGSLGGLNTVDFWVGGLAEKKMAFGGMLGSSFSFVFEMTMENLQDADRFYYLSRTQGLNLLNELENNTFAELVMRNTDLGGDESSVLPGNLFSAFDMPTLEMDKSKQLDADPEHEDPFMAAVSRLVERRDALGNVIPTNPNDHTSVASYIRVNSNEHFTIGGTEGDDTIISGGGDDAIWGRGGNDRIEAGYGVDKVFGGEGDDIITNSGTDIGEVDFLHGNEGNDVIHGGNALSLLFGNDGNDFIITGPDGKEAFAGRGDDFVMGGSGGDALLGNEGNDWLEGGDRFDSLSGENSELFFNSTIIGHDVLNGNGNDTDYDGESGDDIMFQNDGIQRSNGMAGFDWAIHKGDAHAANSNLGIPIFETQEAFILRDRFDLVEGLSGWKLDDVLTGRREAVNTRAEITGTAAVPGPDAPLDSYSSALMQKNVALINGLDQLVAHIVRTTVVGNDGVAEQVVIDTSNASDILLGGGGSDLIMGLAGDDVIDGDKWLNVRIRITDGVNVYTTDSMAGKVYREADYVRGEVVDGAVAQFGALGLDALMLAGTLNPGQLSIVREIVDGDVANEAVDVAVYTDVRDNYTITRNADGSITVAHTGFVNPNGPEDEEVPNLVSDGTDRLFNIEVLRFTDGDVTFTPPELALVGPRLGEYQDNFSSSNYGNSNGNTQWGPDWTETGDDNSATNNNGQIRITNGGLRFEDGNGATIQRVVNLTNATSATFSYSANPDGLDNGETVQVQFSADGVNWTTLNTIGGDSNTTNYSHTLSGAFGPNSAIRFVASSINSNGEQVQIDNVTVDFVTPGTVNYETTFTEGNNEVDIADGPQIIEDSGEIVSARIVLTNAQAGDDFEIPNNLPGAIDSDVDTSVAGQIIVTLTGEETLANYRAAIQAIAFSNNSQNPSTVDRIIEVTVNDGFMDSNVAIATVNVVAVNDNPNAQNDTVITNITTGNIVVPEWALLANDTDVDSVLDITAVSNSNGLGGLSLATTPGSVTFTDTGTAGGSFTYTANDGQDTDNANVTVTRDTTGTIDGNTGDNILLGGTGGDTFDAGTGDDVILAGAGNDTIVWNANNNGDTDGRDFVDGGANTDTFDLNTRTGTNETFRVYTRDAALTGPNAIAGLTAAGLNANTEIVITRTTGTTTTIIAELDNIEEIRIGTQNSDPTNGTAGPGDTVQIFGNFATTSLALNTITIEGTAGDDTVDISNLTSAHRIVFRSNGGHDTIVGTLRPQDVIELADGAVAADYETTTDENGVTTMTNGDHTITFTQDPSGSDDDGDDDDHIGDDDDHDDDDDDHHQPAPAQSDDVLAGGSNDDTLNGGSGDDELSGGAGDDVLSGGSGDDSLTGGEGDDVLAGGSGDDQLLGGAGDDALSGGSGNDGLYGGAGHDVLTGGSGEDLFGFGGGDLATDFAAGHDKIDFRGLGLDAGDLTVTGSGADTLLSIGGETMRLSGVTSSQVTSGSFIFDAGLGDTLAAEQTTPPADEEEFVVGAGAVAHCQVGLELADTPVSTNGPRFLNAILEEIRHELHEQFVANHLQSCALQHDDLLS